MAANTTSVPGKILGIRIAGVWLACQTDATLNMTVNVTEEDPCKPDGDAEVSAANSIPWVTRTADTRDWSMDFSNKLMRDSLKVSNNAQNIAKLIIDGTVYIDDVEFASADGQTASDTDLIYSGPGIITSFTLNAPESGPATMDNTISGNGALTYSYIQVTT